VKVEITLPYPPSVNGMYATFQGRRILSKAGREYKKTVQGIPVTQTFGGDVVLTVNIYRPKRIGDLDNRLKAIQDSLTGLWYADDKQIVEIHAYRWDDKENPRAEVTIECK
jgi:Holliday junction resolvase RusA-like endonuclease